MINTRNLNAKEREEIVKKRLTGYTEIFNFYDIDSMHKTIHIHKIDYPDKKFFASFNGIYFLSDDEDLTSEFMYKTIIGQSREEYMQKREKSISEARQRDVDYKKFIAKRTSDLIKAGMEVLNKNYWEKWVDIVPVRVMDIYNGMDLEWFLELHQELSESTFEHCKMIFETQGHSGMSASYTFSLIQHFAPQYIPFVRFLQQGNGLK